MRLMMKFALSFVMLITSTYVSALQETLRYTQTPTTQNVSTPEQALKMLKQGNEHFLNGNMQNRNYIKQAKVTAKLGQAPFAVILNCMDSRGPVEIILDQGIGDIFSLRVAGNVLNEDTVGSMEYGTKVIGAKMIVVMGHTQCGAVEASCKSVKLGNLTGLLNQIKPAVETVAGSKKINCTPEVVDRIARQNVIDMITNLRHRSKIIDELAANKSIAIVGAMQNLRTGKVSFFDNEGNDL